MITVRKRSIALLLAVASVATLSANTAGSAWSTTSSGSSTVPSEDVEAEVAELYELAKGEGVVVWYATTPEALALAAIDAFEEKYPGVTVEYLRLATADLSQRYASEQEAGAPTADMYLIAEPTFQATAIENGWSAPLEEAGIPGFPAGFPAEFLLSDIGAVNLRVGVAGILYNTDLVDEADVPTSWDDLLDPRWKGEIISGDPAASSSITSHWSTLFAALDEDFGAALGAQDLRFVQGGTVAAGELLAAGEGALLVPGYGSVASPLVKAGAPIGFVVPEPTTATSSIVGLNATAAHPNAVRLFLSFLLSAEGSRHLGNPEELSFSAHEAAEAVGEVLPTTLEAWSAEEAERVIELLGAGG